MTSVCLGSSDTEDSAASVDRPAPEGGDDNAKAHGGVLAQTEEYLRQHPIVRVAIAFGIGALLQTALTAVAKRPPKGTEMQKPKVPQRDLSSEPPSRPRRTHHFGAADMKFTTHHPDGKNVMFKFVWKKRPIDAPEDDWPTDEMGFTSDRPNGKHTAFTFKGKTRPIPEKESAVGDSRPGLGQAAMEFTSSAPGRRDFRFTWSRAPAAEAVADTDQPSGISPIPEGGAAAVSAVNRQKKRPAKKASKKKISKNITSKKSASR